MSQYPESRDARPGEVGHVLTYCGTKYKTFGDEYRIIRAPCCQHTNKQNPCFSINESGMWFCHYTPCGKRGNWITFCSMVGYSLDKNDKYVKYDIVNFRSEWNDVFKVKERSPVSIGKYPKIMEYCNNRGISNATLDAFRISNKWGRAIQVPIFAWHDDKWKRVNARNVTVLKSLDEDKDQSMPKHWFEVKGAPTHLMMGNNLLDLNDPNKRAFIFEGQWDMMTAYEIGLRNVFSLPSGASNVQAGSMLQYIPHDWTIYICMDMDDAGHRAAEKFFCQIGSEKFARLFLPYKDLNDWWQQDKTLTPNDILATARGLPTFKKEEKYANFMDIGFDECLPIIDTPWKSLSNYLQGGFYANQITSILAASGSGKSTIVNQIAIYTASKGFNTGLISLEDTESALMRKLRKAASGIENGTTLGSQNLKLTQMSGQQTKHLELVNEVDKMITESGCRLIIIDNVNFIDGDAKIQLATFRNILSRVRDSGAHVIVVSQPNKVGNDIEITSENQKGFSDIFQGVWNHINININKNDNSLRVMHVEKCRDKWPGANAFVNLVYNDECNLYEEITCSSGKSSSNRSIKLIID